MSQKNNPLELKVSSALKPVDSSAKPTKGSGSTGFHGDVSNKYFIFECKQKLTKDNIIIDYKKEWLKTINKLPITDLRPVIIVTENKQHDIFITMQMSDFFNLVYEAKGAINNG